MVHGILMPLQQIAPTLALDRPPSLLMVPGTACQSVPFVLEQLSEHEFHCRHRCDERTGQPGDWNAFRERIITAIAEDLKMEIAAGRITSTELDSPHPEAAYLVFLLFFTPLAFGRPKLDTSPSLARECDPAFGTSHSDSTHLPFSSHESVDVPAAGPPSMLIVASRPSAQRLQPERWISIPFDRLPTDSLQVTFVLP